VTKKTDCLAVGTRGSKARSSGNCGAKVKKAMEPQEKGSPIRIVKERDVCSLLSD